MEKREKEFFGTRYRTDKRKKERFCSLKKTTAAILAAVMCVTSLPSNSFDTVMAATPANRQDPSIVYYVDCGDYVVNTVGEGEQFGTHNSVTDQVYKEDPQTGYTWGIVDVNYE